MEISILDINNIPDPVFVLVIGSPGAGKNYIVNKYIDTEKFKIVDVDIEKEESFTLSESLAIIRNKFKQYKKELTSFINITSGATLSLQLSKFKRLKESGFKLVTLFIYTDLDKCIERDTQRILNGDRGMGIDYRWKLIKCHALSQLTFESIKDKSDYFCKFMNN